jgi:hypothetical protein
MYVYSYQSAESEGARNACKNPMYSITDRTPH